MLSKLVQQVENIRFILRDISAPANYNQFVTQKTLDLLGPDYPELAKKHDPQRLNNYSGIEREYLLSLDIALIERTFALLHGTSHRLTNTIQASSLGDNYTLLLDRACQDLAILADLSILSATEQTVAEFETKLSILLHGRGRYQNIFEIGETKATLKRLAISDYTKLAPAAKTLVLLRSFAIGILFQTINGFELIQHETCVELGNCQEEEFYSELLPELIATSILFHATLEKTLHILMDWLQHDYLLG